MTTSPEYRTLTHCTQEIIETIARHPNNVANWLLIHGCIDSPVVYKICESGHSSEEQAEELLQWVKDKLIHSSDPSKVYKDFVFALGRNCGFAWSSDVLKSLEVQLAVQELSSGFEPKPKPTVQSTQMSTWAGYESTGTRTPSEPSKHTTKTNNSSSYTQPYKPLRSRTTDSPANQSTHTTTKPWANYKVHLDSSSDSSEDEQTLTQQREKPSDSGYSPLSKTEHFDKPYLEMVSSPKETINSMWYGGDSYNTGRHIGGLKKGSEGTSLFRRNVGASSKPKEIYKNTTKTKVKADDDTTRIICCLTASFVIFLLIILTMAGLVIYFGPPEFAGRMVTWYFSPTGDNTDSHSTLTQLLETDKKDIENLSTQTLSIPTPTPLPKDKPPSVKIPPNPPTPPNPHTPDKNLLDVRPSLTDLLNFRCPDQSTINIAEKISVKYKKFGTIILKDKDGGIVSALEVMFSKNAVLINQEILQMWLLGRGMECRTWRALVGVLYRIGLGSLGSKIEKGVLSGIPSQPQPLTPDEKLLDVRPSLKDLLNFRCPDQSTFNIAEKISVKFREFGIIILNDEDGGMVSTLEVMHSKHAVLINQEILQMWLHGKGIRERTWRALVGVLRRVDLDSLARRIETGVLYSS